MFPPLSIELESNELRLVFSPTADKSELSMKVVSDIYGSSAQLAVNWGDDDFLHMIDYGEISHTYQEVDRDYTVVLKAVDNQSIASFSVSEPESATRIKSLRIGECPKLMDFSVHILDNILERLDFSKNPQFYNSPMFLYINTPNFNFKDFELFKGLNFDIRLPISVSLENMNADYLRIFYTLDSFLAVPEISVTNKRVCQK